MRSSELARGTRYAGAPVTAGVGDVGCTTKVKGGSFGSAASLVATVGGAAVVAAVCVAAVARSSVAAVARSSLCREQPVSTPNWHITCICLACVNETKMS